MKRIIQDAVLIIFGLVLTLFLSHKVFAETAPPLCSEWICSVRSLDHEQKLFYGIAEYEAKAKLYALEQCEGDDRQCSDAFCKVDRAIDINGADFTCEVRSASGQAFFATATSPIMANQMAIQECQALHLWCYTVRCGTGNEK